MNPSSLDSNSNSKFSQNLPKDFLPFGEAIALIQADTRQDPKVDIQFMVSNFPYIQKGHTFNIPLLGRNKDGKIVRTGTRYVGFENEYQATTFEHVVAEKFKELTRSELTPQLTKRSSLIGDADGANPTPNIISSDASDSYGKEI